MGTIRRLALATALSVAFAGVGQADDGGDVRSAITRQLEAFRAGDAQTAYGLAAPNIQTLFPSADIFMGMVRTGYPPVYASRGATFGALSAEGDGFRQDVYLSDAKGRSWIASYTLARQPDGSVRITGCTLREGSDIGA